MNNAQFVNIVNIMSDLENPKEHAEKGQQKSQFSESGLYVREDDQDWGSAGMNDIKQEFDIS